MGLTLARFPFNLFSKSIPAASVPTTEQLEASAWTVDVINGLSEEYATLAKPYTENPVVRAAVEAMRRNAGKAQIQVGYYDEDGGFECIDHPLVTMWSNPTIGESDLSLIEHLYTGLLEDGNGLAVLVTDQDNTTGGTVRELQPVPYSWLQNPPTTVLGDSLTEIVSYHFRGWDWGRGWDFEVPAERVAHIKTGRSQISWVFGRSPLESVRAELALIKLVSIYETTILSRAGVPSWLVSLTGAASSALSTDQLNKLKYDLKNSVSGKRVTSPLIFPGGEMKIDTPGFSPKDLSVQELAEMAVARVCGVLGWAPMSLKQPDTGKTYSNLVEANKASFRDAVIPFLELVAAQLTQAVRTLPFGYGDLLARPDANLSVRFNLDQIEELAIDQKAIADRVIGLVNAGIITINEARADLGMEEQEELDTPAEQAEDMTEQPQDDMPGESEDI